MILFIVPLMFQTETENRAIKDPNFIKNIQGFMENNKAKAGHTYNLLS
jgi:hypothetical protein